MIVKQVLGGQYRLEKYEITDDLGSEYVQMRRGTIFENGTDKIVCRGFDKFFNLGEPHAASIDWNSAKVVEKIDGTNIRIGFWGGAWRISTLGVADVCAEPAESGCDFGNLALRALPEWGKFVNYLDPQYTYIFELTSAENKLVVDYGEKPKLWYLGRRRVADGAEDTQWIDGIQTEVGFPQTYSLHNVEEITEFLNTTTNFEGVVVVDKDWHRVKIKSAEYLRAFRSINVGGKLTDRRLLVLMREGVLDDFAAVAGDKVADFLERYKKLGDYLNFIFETQGKLCADRKEVAFKVIPLGRAYTWKKMTNPELKVNEWLDMLTLKGVLDMLQVVS